MSRWRCKSWMGSKTNAPGSFTTCQPKKTGRVGPEGGESGSPICQGVGSPLGMIILAASAVPLSGTIVVPTAITRASHVMCRRHFSIATLLRRSFPVRQLCFGGEPPEKKEAPSRRAEAAARRGRERSSGWDEGIRPSRGIPVWSRPTEQFAEATPWSTAFATSNCALVRCVRSRQTLRSRPATNLGPAKYDDRRCSPRPRSDLDRERRRHPGDDVVGSPGESTMKTRPDDRHAFCD